MISDKTIQSIVTALNNDLTHIGIGNGGEPLPSDSTLDGEIIVKEVESYVDGNEIIKEIYLDENEANGLTIKNVGLYDEMNELRAGGPLNISKSENESMTISVEIEVERV